MPIPGLIMVGMLLGGVVAVVEGIASAWYNPQGIKSKILIIGGIFVMLDATNMIKKAVLGN